MRGDTHDAFSTRHHERIWCKGKCSTLFLGRVRNRFEWVRALTESHYDVVLVEVNIAGLQVATRQIRELEQSPRELVSGVHIPTVGLCVAPQGVQAAEPAIDGIDDFVEPLSEGAVLAKVREWTVRARSRPLLVVGLDRIYEFAGDLAIMWAMVDEFVQHGALFRGTSRRLRPA